MHRAPVAGLAADRLGIAIALEKRKQNASFNRVDAPSIEDCPPLDRAAVLVVGGEDEAWLQSADGSLHPLEIKGVDPLDRAQEAARRVVALVVAPGGVLRTTIVDGDLPDAPQPLPQPSKVCPGCSPCPPAALVDGYVQVGGRYDYHAGPALHAGSLEVEGGVVLLDERLLVGFRTGWLPGQVLPAAAQPTRIQAVPFAAMIRVGFRLSPVLLRFAAGSGLEWRRITVRPTAWAGTRTHTDVVAMLAAEVEAVLPAGRFVRLSIAATAEGYPEAGRYTYNGRRLFDETRASVGVALRIGFVIPEVR